MSQFYEGEDVEGASRWLKDAAYRKGGAKCPCCGRHVQVYKRSFTIDMACFLILLVKEYGKIVSRGWEWVDVKQFNVRGGDYAKVLHWGLAVLKENDFDPSRKNVGMWKPTHEGIRFVQDKLQIPSHKFLYLNEVVGQSNKLIGIRDALGTHFDYEVLMNS